MAKIDQRIDLKMQIEALTVQQKQEWELLKQEMNTTIAALQPASILRNSLQQVKSIGNIKETIIGTALGLATGYISKKIIVGNSHQPLRNLFGNLIQWGMANLVKKNVTLIETLTTEVAHKLNSDTPAASS